jgi:hypothetical protein
MRSLKLLLALVLTATAVPATASAAGVDGTYTGESDEGQEVTIEIRGGEPASITGAFVRELECTRIDPTQAPPNDLQPRGTKRGSFAIDTSDRGGTPNSRFFVGSPESTPTTGDHVYSTGDGEFARNADGTPFIRFRMSYEETSESGQDGRRTQCNGNAEAQLARPAAPGNLTKLRRPRNLQGKVKAKVAPLDSIGDDGIKVSATTGPKAVGGRIEVSVRRDPDAEDELRFGNGKLGSGAKTVAPRRRETSFRVDMKRPLRTPSKGDKVPMLVTVEFTDRAGKSRSATTRIVVK